MRKLALTIALTGLLAILPALAQTPAVKLNPAAGLSPIPASANTDTSSQPLWKDLSSAEQSALRPLAANWDSMNLGRKRKWQSVAKDFDKLPAAQQSKMHARMAGWAALSTQQRAAARMNFAQNRELTDGLTSEQRKVQWDAYQQLSPEEKRKLAHNAPKAAAIGAAPAARPQPVLKKDPAPQFGTAKVLNNAMQANQAAPGRKIAVAPYVAEQGSILRGQQAQTAAKP